MKNLQITWSDVTRTIIEHIIENSDSAQYLYSDMIADTLCIEIENKLLIEINRAIFEEIPNRADRLKLSDMLRSNLLYGCNRLGGNYVMRSTTDQNKLAYIPLNRLPLFAGKYDDEILRRKYAVQCKPHKLIKRIFSALSDTQINTVVQNIMVLEQKIRIFEGDDINRIYDKNLLYSDTGNLHSCMINHYDTRKFEIYRENCRAIALVDTHDKISARAILWQNVKNNHGDILGNYCDRIYSRNSEARETILQYCADNGILCNLSENTCVCPSQYIDGYWNKIESYLSVELCRNADTYELLPYMDTFFGAESGDNTLYSCSGTYEIRDYTDGVPFEVVIYHCSCGCYSSNDESEFVFVESAQEYYNIDCYNICYTVDGDYELKANCNYSDYHNEWIHTGNENYVYCDDRNDYIHIDELTYCEVREEYFLNDDTRYLVYKGYSVHEEECTYCEACGEYFLNDDIKQHDGTDYCEDCYNEVIETETETETETAEA